jgi:hypothetical protein
MSRLIVAIIALAALASAAPATDCLRANRAGETAHGRLVERMFTDAADRPERAYIIELPAAICLSGDEDAGPVEGARTLHIFASEENVARRIRRFVGKRVRVRGSAFGAITAHHHAPIVMDISAIDLR